MKNKLNKVVLVGTIVLTVIPATGCMKLKTKVDDSETTASADVVIDSTFTSETTPEPTTITEYNEDDEITKVQTEDGFTIYTWNYFKDSFNEIDEKEENSVVYFRLMEEQEKEDLLKQLKEQLDSIPTSDKTDNFDMILEIYRTAKDLILTSVEGQDYYFWIGKKAKEYIVSLYGGSEVEPDVLYEQLQKLFEQYTQYTN